VVGQSLKRRPYRQIGGQMDTTAKIGEDKPRHYGRSSIQKVAAGFIPARLMLCRGIGSAVQGERIKERCA
jgi:hypothetical protein